MNLPSKTECEILDLLRSGREMYGLEMVKESRSLKRGTIYVTLLRMGEKGFVTSRPAEDETQSGSRRRLYHITGLGQQALAAKRAAEEVMATGLAAGGHTG